MASLLTEQDVDDASQVEALLEQIPQMIEQVTADGAYDGEPTYEVIADRGQDIEVVIPPRASSVQPVTLDTNATRHDVHVHTVATLGRLGWQAAIGVAALNRMLAAGRPNSVRRAASAT